MQKTDYGLRIMGYELGIKAETSTGMESGYQNDKGLPDDLGNEVYGQKYGHYCQRKLDRKEVERCPRLRI